MTTSNYNRVKTMLIAQNGYCAWEMACPKDFPNQFRLECWVMPAKGVLLLQVWKEGGVTTYADWPTGHTWEELEALLKPESPDPA